MELGYWNKLDTGELRYTSLSDSGRIQFVEDEQIWNIISFDKWVLFQSLNNIYIYDSELESFNTIKSQSKITKSFLLDDGRIFYQDLNFGLFEIKNGKSKLVATLETLSNEVIIDVFEDADNYVLLTQNRGFFYLNSKTKKISTWDLSLIHI